MKAGLFVASFAFVLSAPVHAQRSEPPTDTAAARWMRDTVTRDLASRPGMVVGFPTFRADTAHLTASRTETTPPDRIYVFSIEYRFERRDGVWLLMPTRMFSHAHGKRVPK